MLSPLVLLLCVSLTSSEPLRLSLRTDWAGGHLYTPLAHQINESQHRCQNKIFHHMRNYGMGSDLHTWSQALCNAMERNYSLVQRYEPWIWNSESLCSRSRGAGPLLPLECYFQMTNTCPVSMSEMPTIDLSDRTIKAADRDPRFIAFQTAHKTAAAMKADEKPRNIFRAASMEYLFSRVSPALIADAEVAAGELFRDVGSIPKNLITVHIRWGDKRAEMRLVSIKTYIDSIKDLIKVGKIGPSPSIFLTTEDANAVKEMRASILKDKDAQAGNWRLYTLNDAHFDQKQTRAKNEPNAIRNMMLMNNLTDGKLGYNSLVALLIALEADYFVLTTGSNWSRLINELRLNVVEPSKKLRNGGICELPGNLATPSCTYMLDLRKSGRNGDE